MPNTLAQFMPKGNGSRVLPGKIQSALLDAYQAQINVRLANQKFEGLRRRFEHAYTLFSELITQYDAATAANDRLTDKANSLIATSANLSQSANYLSATADFSYNVLNALAEAGPTMIEAGTSVGFDPGAIPKGVFLGVGSAASYALNIASVAQQAVADGLSIKADNLKDDAQGFIDDYNFDAASKMHVVEFERIYDDMSAAAGEISRQLIELQNSSNQVAQLVAQAQHILSERETFRQRAAAVVQGYRTKDVVYRQLRNEQLSQYKSLFDLAQTYVYSAAKAYNYETGLLKSAVGDSYMEKVIGTFSLGNFSGNTPVAGGLGDSGLASVLADLSSEFSVVKGRLGINNPDRNGSLFSLRQELYRIRTDQATTEDNKIWKQVLQQNVMSNVMNDPDVALYCSNLAKANGSPVPGIVLSFGTMIQPGMNFFGWPLAPGDSAYSQSTFATKIASVGMVFKGYVGMQPYSAGTPNAAGPSSSNPNALSATPYAYLIPAGADTMRSPPLGDSPTLGTWSVKDQALPLPKNLGASSFSSQQLFTPTGSLNEQLWIMRKHQAFRPVDDPVYFYGSIPAEYTNSRLIGRSVWNSQWKIVIPAYSLLNNEQEGLDRFIKSVSDIKLFLRTYSTSGN
jgi:hypothetical protein